MHCSDDDGGTHEPVSVSKSAAFYAKTGIYQEHDDTPPSGSKEAGAEAEAKRRSKVLLQWIGFNLYIIMDKVRALGSLRCVTVDKATSSVARLDGGYHVALIAGWHMLGQAVLFAILFTSTFHADLVSLGYVLFAIIVLSRKDVFRGM